MEFPDVVWIKEHVWGGEKSFLNDNNRGRLAGSVLTGKWRDKNSINGVCTA
jgi:hypothetical protein